MLQGKNYENTTWSAYQGMPVSMGYPLIAGKLAKKFRRSTKCGINLQFLKNPTILKNMPHITEIFKIFVHICDLIILFVLLDLSFTDLLS